MMLLLKTKIERSKRKILIFKHQMNTAIAQTETYRREKQIHGQMLKPLYYQDIFNFIPFLKSALYRTLHVYIYIYTIAWYRIRRLKYLLLYTCTCIQANCLYCSYLKGHVCKVTPRVMMIELHLAYRILEKRI